MVSQIIERAKAPTPKFFKKVRNSALTVSVVSGALLEISKFLPNWMHLLLVVLTSLASGIAGTSQLTKE